MLKSKTQKIIVLLSIAVFLTMSVMSNTTSALLSQNTKTWFTFSDTNIASSAIGDVNADGQNELVTAGYFNDGTHWNAQLVVWDPTTMTVIAYRSWTTLSDTQLTAVTVGDVNNDGLNEVVTGGSFFDGTRWNVELAVWNGATMVVTAYKSWFTVADTQISSLAIGDVDGVAGNEIVTAGSFFDGTIWHAELVVLDGATLAVNAFRAWITASDTQLTAVTVGDVNNDGLNEVVTGSSFFFNSQRYAELAVWTGSTMTVSVYRFWSTIGSTLLNSLVVGNVNGIAGNELVTGGSFFDGTRWNSELAVWDGATMVVNSYRSWFTTSNTQINAIAIGQYNAGTGLDIFTIGTTNDGFRDYAQLLDWNGVSLSLVSMTSWFTTAGTEANSIAFGLVSGSNAVFTAGSYYDNSRQNAQIITWR